MRVATFNIQHGRGSDGSPPDADALARAIAGLDAHVVGLQEVDRDVPRSGGTDQLAVVASAMQGVSAFGATMTLDGGSYGNGLVVRGTIDAVEELALPGRRRQQPRGLLVARVRVAERSLTVAVTHLATDAALARDQLVATLEALSATSGPAVLLADLNLRPPAVLPFTTATGLRVVLTGATFPVAAPVAAIDVVAVRELATGPVDIVATGISDHRAVVVTVR